MYRFRPPELPKFPDFESWDVLAIDPLVDRVTLDPEAGRNLLHGKPAIFGRAAQLKFLAWFT